MSNNQNKTQSEREEDILAYWEENKCFENSIESRPEEKPYVFYDGPPFATGLPHYGHLVGSVMKDVVPRYWTMKGYRVDRKWGWDCHGLPIENIVEKKFDLGTKKDIEDFGIERFNSACGSEVLLYADEWKQVIRRIGRWVDMKNAYHTMDDTFMESSWWVFKQLFDKNLIYEGRKPMHICPRCETALSNFEVNQGYADVKDISVYALFTLTSGKYKGDKMVAWTTTPWTLPGNVLLAVKEDLTYVLVESEGNRIFSVKERVEDVFEDKEFKILEEVSGADLIGETYEPLFPFFADHKNAFRVVGADFVTTEDGSGIVHIAPGFGEDDKNLGAKERVDAIMHVQMNGQFVDEVAKPMQEAGYNVLGIPVKRKDDTMTIDIEILKWLAHNDKLFKKKKLEHSYPLCWRCDTPLLNYGTSSWFVRVTDIKDQLVETNKQINWTPDNMKEGRFGKWLEGARDWAISRSRFWGTPLPIWRNEEDGDLICVGSVQELKDLSGVDDIKDLHKHTIDKIVIEKDGKTYTRIPEVLDCWFESGSMPYAQLHYPFENKEVFERGFPAEFIAEGQDQTRGWFYTLHILSNALFGKPAFKNVVVNGIVLAEDGKKMSKRLKNYPDPVEVINKYGADSIRYYLMSSPVVRAENLSFTEKDVHEVQKKFVNIMTNVLAFYKLYSDIDDGRTPNLEHSLDAWIMARLNETLKDQTNAMDNYDLSGGARVLQGFVTDLSTWYVRRSRDRVKTDGEDQKEAIATLRTVLDTFSKMIAPVMPFLAESLYQGVGGEFGANDGRVSVHLEDWPEAVDIDEAVIAKMGEARAIVSRTLDLREDAGRPIKQVLGAMVITIPDGKIDKTILSTILDEVNVKTASIEEGDLSVSLDTELTPELKREGMVRDVIRRVNSMRKKAGLTIEDRISLKIWSEEEEVKLMFDEYGDVIKSGVLASDIAFEEIGDVENRDEFRIYEKGIEIGF